MKSIASLLCAGALFAGACSDGDGAAPMPPNVCGDQAARPGLVQRTQCGPTADFIPIHQYQGEVAAVQAREDAVVLINGSCTGTLIAAASGPVVLTAGHCAPLGGDVTVAFNVETEADGDPLVTTGTVIEQSDAPDYELVQLMALPVATPPTQLTTDAGDLLAIIQHPRGRPKVIAEGDYLDACNGEIFYTDLDTLVGSSGAGVLNRRGHLVGIHTDGDCTDDGHGANRGWSAASIVEASAYLQSGDLAER
jgi:Trypsin-like peptidase domain